MNLDSLPSRFALDWNRRLMWQPYNAHCVDCGVMNPLVLVLPAKPALRDFVIRCYECRSRWLGRSGSEGHHLGGRSLSSVPVVRIPGNLHRVLTYLQVTWRRMGVTQGSDDAVRWDEAMLWSLRELWR